jgi:hypothetical protein
VADPLTSVLDPLAQVGRFAAIKVTTDPTVDDFDYIFHAPAKLRAMSLHGQGSSFGAGTLSLQGSNDGDNFFALPTAVSITANGVASVALADLGYRFYRIHLTGSTNPTLTAIVSLNLG